MKTRIGLFSIAGWALISLGSWGCTHLPVQGTVMTKLTDHTAVVKIKNVQVGDHVALIDNDCQTTATHADGYHCRRELQAKGVISQVINGDTTEAQFPAGTQILEGQMVELIR